MTNLDLRVAKILAHVTAYIVAILSERAFNRTLSTVPIGKTYGFQFLNPYSATLITTGKRKRDLDLPSRHDLSGNLHMGLPRILVQVNKLKISRSWLSLYICMGTKHGRILDLQ